MKQVIGLSLSMCIQDLVEGRLGNDVIVHAIRSPATVAGSTPLREAVDIMGKRQIWDLPVVDQGKLHGLLHLHPAISAILKKSK